MRAVFLNDVRRLWAQKQLIVLLVVFTTVAAVAATLLSSGISQGWEVAVVGGWPGGEVEAIAFMGVEQAPGLAELVSGRYDGMVTVNEDGSYVLETIKSEMAAEELKAALEGREAGPALFSGRGPGTNLLGFITTFILLMGSMAMCLYADDKIDGQIGRVAASPVGIGAYLAAHSLFNFCFLYLPTMVVLALVWAVSGVELGYSFLQLAALVAVLCLLSTAFCLFLYSVLSNKADSAKMTGNALIILTSILAGSFYAFDSGNRVLGVLIRALPQKAYLDLAGGIEQGAALTAWLYPLAYLMVVTGLFYGVALWKTRCSYVNRR